MLLLAIYLKAKKELTSFYASDFRDFADFEFDVFLTPEESQLLEWAYHRQKTRKLWQRSYFPKGFHLHLICPAY